MIWAVSYIGTVGTEYGPKRDEIQVLFSGIIRDRRLGKKAKLGRVDRRDGTSF